MNKMFLRAIRVWQSSVFMGHLTYDSSYSLSDGRAVMLVTWNRDCRHIPEIA
ncbi:MAG: hypothetical protein GZ088_02280 [Acidipila sp.]|nr:hypothetical protein [Acidipila sp.]